MRVPASSIVLLTSALLLSISVGSPCSAQGGGPLSFDVTYSFEAERAGSFSESTSLFFDDDCLEDVAYIQGGEVYVVLAPGLYANIIQIPNISGATAIAPISGPEGNELLIASEEGLTAWSVDPNDEPSAFLDARTIGTTIWCGARAIDIGSDGQSIYGLSADGLQFLRFEGLDEIVLPMPTIGLDLVTVDWDDSNGIDEVAISTSAGDEHSIIVVTVDGGSEYYCWVPNAAIDLTVVREQDKERIAAVGKGLNGVTDTVLLIGNGVNPRLHPLGNVDATGIAAGDLDADGFDDLVVGIDATRGALVLPGPVADMGHWALPGAVNDEAAGQTQVPTIVDVDQDQDLDVVQYFAASSSSDPGSIFVSMQEAPSLEENDFGGTNPFQPAFDDIRYFEDQTEANPDVYTGYLSFDLSPPAGGYPSGTTHVEIGFWVSEYDRLNNRWQEAVPAGRSHALLVNNNTLRIGRGFEFDDLDETRKERVIYYAARFVEAPGNQIISQTYDRVYPPLIHAFAAIAPPNDLTNPMYLSVERVMDLGGVNDPIGLTLYKDVDPLDRPVYRGSNPVIQTLGTWIDPASTTPGEDLPSDTGVGTPIRPLPKPEEEWPEPRFGENGT